MEIWLTFLIVMVSIVLGGLLTWIIGKAQQTPLLRRLRDALIDREHVSMNEEFLMTQLLAEKIQKANFIPDVIFAICPGGAMIAEWLSRRFLGNFSASIPVESLCITTERKSGSIISNKAKVDDKWIAIPSTLSPNSKVLLVTDISRSGHTLEAAYELLKNHFPDANIQRATLFCHTYSSVIPEFYVAMTEKVTHFDWK